MTLASNYKASRQSVSMRGYRAIEGTGSVGGAGQGCARGSGSGVLSEQEGVGWVVWWQSASKMVEEKVVLGLQMVSTEAAGSFAPAGCWAQQSVEVIVSLNGLSVAFAQCHA